MPLKRCPPTFRTRANPLQRIHLSWKRPTVDLGRAILSLCKGALPDRWIFVFEFSIPIWTIVHHLWCLAFMLMFAAGGFEGVCWEGKIWRGVARQVETSFNLLSKLSSFSNFPTFLAGGGARTWRWRSSPAGTRRAGSGSRRSTRRSCCATRISSASSRPTTRTRWPGPSSGWWLTSTSTAACSTTWASTPCPRTRASTWRATSPTGWHTSTWRYQAHRASLLSPIGTWSRGTSLWRKI